MSPVIEFQNVSKRFILHSEERKTIQEQAIGLFQRRDPGDEFWAVRDLSFSVEKGQSIGFVGHNGAGKSTTLKLMTRILEPTSGSVQIEGRVAALLELGSGFHPDLTGRENIFLFGSLMGLNRRQMEERLDDILEFAEIGRFIDTEIKHYSSGMYSRLAFAAATAVDPDILITDEVMAVGDEAFQRKCMERIYSFRRRQKTIVFVSHALEVVRGLCDIGVWLDHGIPRKVGPIGEVIDAYLAEVNRKERLAAAAAAGISAEEAEELAEEGALNPLRRGTREVEITRVELIGSSGGVQPTFTTGEELVIRMHYIAREPVDGPVFGVGIYHENGLWLSGPNTGFADIRLPELFGEGFIDYRIPRLPLLGGRYQVSVAVVDRDQIHTFDLHDRLYRLIVQSESFAERYGMMTFSGEWQLQTSEKERV